MPPLAVKMTVYQALLLLLLVNHAFQVTAQFIK